MNYNFELVTKGKSTIVDYDVSKNKIITLQSGFGSKEIKKYSRSKMESVSVNMTGFASRVHLLEHIDTSIKIKKQLDLNMDGVSNDHLKRPKNIRFFKTRNTDFMYFDPNGYLELLYFDFTSAPFDFNDAYTNKNFFTGYDTNIQNILILRDLAVIVIFGHKKYTILKYVQWPRPRFVEYKGTFNFIAKDSQFKVFNQDEIIEWSLSTGKIAIHKLINSDQTLNTSRDISIGIGISIGKPQNLGHRIAGCYPLNNNEIILTGSFDLEDRIQIMKYKLYDGLLPLSYKVPSSLLSPRLALKDLSNPFGNQNLKILYILPILNKGYFVQFLYYDQNSGKKYCIYKCTGFSPTNSDFLYPLSGPYVFLCDHCTNINQPRLFNDQYITFVQPGGKKLHIIEIDNVFENNIYTYNATKKIEI